MTDVAKLTDLAAAAHRYADSHRAARRGSAGCTAKYCCDGSTHKPHYQPHTCAAPSHGVTAATP